MLGDGAAVIEGDHDEAVLALDGGREVEAGLPVEQDDLAVAEPAQLAVELDQRDPGSYGHHVAIAAHRREQLRHAAHEGGPCRVVVDDGPVRTDMARRPCAGFDERVE